MSEGKPCGNIHPLPCGVDEDCGFLEGYTGNTGLRELIETWREQSELQGQFGNEGLSEMAEQHADELEDLLDGE